MTTISGSAASALDRLKQLLQAISPGQFESLAAALISHVLNVEIAVAKSGFQHGGDAGPAGRQGRRFRIETKRYGDGTALSDRELLGEIDHALVRDPALEAWCLVATRAAPEQLEQDLLGKADQLGLPVLVIDWKRDGFPAFAALCTASPDLLETMVSDEAGALARELAGHAANHLERLQLDFAVWNLGYEHLRAVGAAALARIWSSPRASVAALGQNAAGGASPKTIKRPRVHEALDQWWAGRASEDAPAAVIGSQGSGKTWATLQWSIDHIDALPLTLLIPSTMMAGVGPISKASLKHFIGERLYDLTGTRNGDHWQLRFDRMLQRPVEEGPVVTLIFDGMNQEPGAPWLPLLKLLQDPVFAGQIRTIVVTRNLHFEDRLASLGGLFVPPEVVEVDIYDLAEGGELDQRLAAEGLTRTDLHDDLVDIARTPRLFDLVVRLRKKFANAEHVTIHRLLWEYGRDSMGERAGAPFSEADWRVWLAQVAEERLAGIQSYTLGSLTTMVARADLNSTEVYRRLSEIVDPAFSGSSASGRFTLSPMLVDHALGAALLQSIADANPSDKDEVEKILADWLDPIAGLDERAEILRAATSILLESPFHQTAQMLPAILFEWLRSQNLPEQHRTELMLIAAPLCEPLLDILERSGEAALGTARVLARAALRGISREDADCASMIIERCASWLTLVSREVDLPSRRNADSEKSRSERLILRVGFDADGDRTILGHRLTFVERHHREAEGLIPDLLEGFPLAPAIPVFELAALANALRHHQSFWDGLKWICLFNSLDFGETATALKQRAMEIAVLEPEAGVHSDLGKRVAALLLWLSGDEDNEALASGINPSLDRNWDYQKDYLERPGISLFAVERRHAEQVLADMSIILRVRVDRTQKFLLDPSFEPPAIFCAELRAAMNAFDVNSLDTSLSHTSEDNIWEAVTPALARCAPDLFASLVRRKLHGFAERPADDRYFAGMRADEHFLLVDAQARDAAEVLRRTAHCPGEAEQCYLASTLLILEIAELPAVEQVARILEADLEKGPDRDMAEVLKRLTGADVDGLIDRFGAQPDRQRDQLVTLLYLAQGTLTDFAWGWLADRAEDPDFAHGGLAMKRLYDVDPDRLGRRLLGRRWQWTPGEDLWRNHYGSLALAEASVGLPLDQVISSIAPWLILRAVWVRGGSRSDVEIGCDVISAIFGSSPLAAPDLGSNVFVYDEAREEDPSSFSVSLRPDPDRDQFERFRDALDSDKQRKARQRAVEIAVERMKEAREAGASLYLFNLIPDDFNAVIAHAPGIITSWIEGYEALTSAFKRRVQLAEGFYLALCEALLASGTDLGVPLWHALRRTFTASYIGLGGVDKMMLIALRSEPLREELWHEMISLDQANTDKALFDLALATALTGRHDLLQETIASDETSGVVWRRRRARKWTGFRAGHRIPLTAPWPEGETASAREDRERDMHRWQRTEAFARYWWDRYWTVESDEEAYAAWHLLLHCIDRRGHAWMYPHPSEFDAASPTGVRRIAHARLNSDALKRAMNKPEKKLDEQFLDRKIMSGIGPWVDGADPV